MPTSSTIRFFSIHRRVLTHWSVGMVVVTPVIALLQGSLLLSEFRINFKDAPRPITPASGMIAAVPESHTSTTTAPQTTRTDKPLRLLVVGDSLAAGVGVSGNGLPVLPESIAKALSKALGGRVVCWTCVGTPGISASQIVQDINSIPRREPRRIEQLLQELKIKREKWKQLQLVNRQEENEANKLGLGKKIADWWKQGKDKQPIGEFTKEIGDSITNWWKRNTHRMQQTVKDIQEVINAKAIDEDEDEHEKDAPPEQKVVNLVRKGSLFRRDSLDPYVASSFDVAVVLLGLNDVKEAFMPHMNDGSELNDAALNKQLHKLFHALKRVMGKMGDKEKDTTTANNDSAIKDTSGKENANTSQVSPLHPPLVVVPELPVAPLEAFQLVPLCWFLLPLFRAMEQNKKFLSSTFPDHVVFIDQPDLKWWSDAEQRHERYKQEEKEDILRLTDIAEKAQARVKGMMERFKRRKEEEEGREGGGGGTSLESSIPTEYNVSMQARDQDLARKSTKAFYIAQDKMHPNDDGYDLWGRHIAEAVVRHWDSRPQV